MLARCKLVVSLRLFFSSLLGVRAHKYRSREKMYTRGVSLEARRGWGRGDDRGANTSVDGLVWRRHGQFRLIILVLVWGIP